MGPQLPDANSPGRVCHATGAMWYAGPERATPRKVDPIRYCSAKNGRGRQMSGYWRITTHPATKVKAKSANTVYTANWSVIFFPGSWSARVSLRY
jgi:hypothetical protein